MDEKMTRQTHTQLISEQQACLRETKQRCLSMLSYMEQETVRLARLSDSLSLEEHVSRRSSYELPLLSLPLKRELLVQLDAAGFRGWTVGELLSALNTQPSTVSSKVQEL